MKIGKNLISTPLVPTRIPSDEVRRVGSARRWRAVFGGPPKTSFRKLLYWEKRAQSVLRRLGRAAQACTRSACAPHFSLRNSVLISLMISRHASAADFLTASHLVSDLNPGSNGSFPSNFTTFSSSLYFSAYTFTTGRELWRYDGTSIVLTTNINDTGTDIGGGLMEGNGSEPKWFTAYHSRLFFSAFDPRRGDELWSYDGTNAGRVADINPDANDAIKPNSKNSFPSELTVFDDALYFSADNGGNQTNYELWKYNGTNASIGSNLNPGNASSFPNGLTVFQGALYFSADDGSHGFELWKHTGSQTVLFDINPGGANSSSYPKNFLPFNGKLYFQAFHPSYGFELWKTDGNTVSFAADINPGTGSSSPEFPIIFRQALYFRATDGIHGSELWKFDGTNATMAADINPNGDSFPKNFTVFNDQLYFSADDGTQGWELWKYDGTNASIVTNHNASSDSFPEWLTSFDNALYFVATTPETGYELWRYDGNAVTLAADINPGVNSSFPLNLRVHNGQLFFSATQNGGLDYELWTLLTAPLRIQSLQPTAGNMQIFWSTLGGRRTSSKQAGILPGLSQTSADQSSSQASPTRRRTTLICEQRMSRRVSTAW